jgi:flagellar hook-associated protein 1 FlgK
MNLVLRAMLAHQEAIQTVEHNVANANVPGYHRQEVLFAASRAHPAPGFHSASGGPGQLGTGMDVEGVRRFKLEVYDLPYWRTLGEASYWNSRSGALERVESALPETGSASLIAKLDEFWDGWRALSSDPADLVLRAQVKDRSAALATAFNQRATELQGIRLELSTHIGGLVDEINQTAQHIANLNEEIAQVLGQGNRPNDLLDQRDRLIERLAEIGGAVSYEGPDGQVSVSIGGHALVVAGSTFTLYFHNTPGEKASDRLSWSAVPPATPPPPFPDPAPVGGKLAGLIGVYDQDIQDQLDGLDSLAAALRDKVNTAHKEGYTADGVTHGLDLFVGTAAAAMAMNPAITGAAQPLDLIAASSVSGAVGDGSNARKIAEFQAEAFLAGGRTASETYLAQITGLGGSIKLAKGNGEAQELVSATLRQQRESASGVSLDEEAANLAKYQRTYQALARLMTSLDEMMDQVINGMGRAGR